MPIKTTTDLPFGEAVRQLMREHDLTFGELSERLGQEDTHGRGRGLSRPHLANLAHGREQPSARAIDLIAAHFGLQANYFAENRLAAARARLDPATNGFDAAQEEARAIQQAHPCYPACPPASTTHAEPGERCELCKLDPVKRYYNDPQAANLLETHVDDDRRTMLVCPTCHQALHSGFETTDLTRRIPAAIDDPGLFRTRQLGGADDPAHTRT